MNGRRCGGAEYGSPGMLPAITSSTAALSRTERVTTCSMASPCQASPMSGPSDTRPRDGFSPTKPHSLAGMRIEPPPSLAWATATIRDATAAAEPPLEPPVDRVGFHGLGDGPNASGSVVALRPNSGVLVFPRQRNPAGSEFCRQISVVRRHKAGVAQQAHAAARAGRLPCPHLAPARLDLLDKKWILHSLHIWLFNRKRRAL